MRIIASRRNPPILNMICANHSESKFLLRLILWRYMEHYVSYFLKNRSYKSSGWLVIDAHRIGTVQKRYAISNLKEETKNNVSIRLNSEGNIAVIIKCDLWHSYFWHRFNANSESSYYRYMILRGDDVLQLDIELTRILAEQILKNDKLIHSYFTNEEIKEIKQHIEGLPENVKSESRLTWTTTSAVST